MSKKKPTPKKPKRPGVYTNLDADTLESLRLFVSRQPVEPSDAAVTLAALRHFLQSHGCYPPPRPPAK